MDQEQRFVKSSKIFSLTIDNFNEQIHEVAIERPLMEVSGHLWQANIPILSENGVDYLSVKTKADVRIALPGTYCEKFFTEMAICVKNESSERWEKRQGRFEVGYHEWVGWDKFMRMDTILNPNSGFMTDDGSLVIQFEIRVDLFTDKNGNRVLNIFDDFEGSVVIKSFRRNYYMCKQMLMFHSPVLAEQLADGRNKVVLSEYVFTGSIDPFLQLIHGVKMEVNSLFTVHILLLAHKYQVIAVLRQLEFQFKSCSDEYIHDIFIPFNIDWIKTLLGKKKKHDRDLQKMDAVCDKRYSEKYKKLNIRKRKMLLAITRAPFYPDLDYGPPCSPANSNSKRSPSFISRLFSKTFKSITGR